MINCFNIGDSKTFTKLVESADTAIFESGEVHPVYSTFALGRDAEWVCRQFVLAMKETHEEGIGTFLNITHHSPALIGNTVEFVAVLQKIEGNSIICTFEAKVQQRLIASGQTGQKILTKEKIQRLFERL